MESFFLKPHDTERGYQFRSLRALHTFLEITPPYRTCLAYAPYARNAPHCSRLVNQKKAAAVAGLLNRLLRTSIPSTEAQLLLEDLSTHAVCGITGWHQNKAAEVQSKWLHELWEEYLRIHGLEPRLWTAKAPFMTIRGWKTNLVAAWREQVYDSDDSDGDDDYDSDDNDDYDSDDDDDDDSEDSSDDDSDDDSSENEDDHPDHYDGNGEDQGLLSEPTQSSYATTSDSYSDDMESWSSEGLVTPNTTDSELDDSSAEETGLAPDTSTDLDQISSDGHVPGPEEPNEGGNPDQGSSFDDLLALGSDIFSDSDELNAFPQSSHRHPGFRVYPQAPSPVSQLMQLLNLMTQTVSHRRRWSGFIYGFARPSLPGFLKIGVMKDTIVPQRLHPDPVDHRLATWQAQCGHPVVEVFRRQIVCDAAERIESLVHLALREHRRVEDPPCRRCERRKKAARARHKGQRSGGKHDEWLEVETQTAVRAVQLLVAFSDQRPYDKFGKLIDFWSDKTEEKKRLVTPDDTVKGWLETMPRLVEEHTRSELDSIIGRFCSLG